MTWRQIVLILFLCLIIQTICKGAEGIASFYGEDHRGRPTANRELFNPDNFTCASWHYRFNTRLLVTNMANGRSVVVRVNDRGPARRLHRAIDLSAAAFRQIADPDVGLIQVRIEKL